MQLDIYNLPWRAVPRDELEIFGRRVIEDAKGDEVALEVFDEDAEFIVRAVNAHEQLLRALHAAREALLFSAPFASNYPEPIARHRAAYEAVCNALDAGSRQ